MNWSDVGSWLKDNAGSGAALVGSLITGNIPGAVAAGVAMVSSATGSNDPGAALTTLQSDPATVVRLRELAVQEEASIREHIRQMHELELKDKQAEQETTGKVVMSGDNAEDVVVRRTRPLQSWCSLLAAFGFVFGKGVNSETDLYVLGLLLALPWAYAGLRQVGKGIDTIKGSKQ